MRWRALETGRVFVKQRIGENHLSVEEPKEMVNRGETSFASRVMRFSSSLHGTRQYWCTQRLNLAAMQEALGMPTIFFTLSAADTQWPELQDLMCHYRPNANQDRASERIKAVIENPYWTDWFFLHRAEKFMRYFLQNSLGAVDFWARIEYQHRGSSHLHGVAWLADAPHSDKISSEWACMHRASESGEAEATSEQMRRAEDIAQEVYDFADAPVTTWNPTLNETGEGHMPRAEMHSCHKRHRDVTDEEQDYAELIANVQRHTKCSTAYCLRRAKRKRTSALAGDNDHGSEKELQCRFKFPKVLSSRTHFELQDKQPELVTRRNDSRINGHNRARLTGWRANVDMQVCVNAEMVSKYMTKYASKSEVMSGPLKKTFEVIVEDSKDDDHPKKAVQKLMTRSVIEHDYSAQETCHHLTGEKLVVCSRTILRVNVDGQREVDVAQDKQATISSAMDHYVNRPKSNEFENLCFDDFVTQYDFKRTGRLVKRNKKAVIRYVPEVKAALPNDLEKYETYCSRQLVKYKPFRCPEEPTADFGGSAVASWEEWQGYCSDDLTRRICFARDVERAADRDEVEIDGDNLAPCDVDENGTCNNRWHALEDGMVLCQLDADFSESPENEQSSDSNTDWTASAVNFPDAQEAITFIARNKSEHGVVD